MVFLFWFSVVVATYFVYRDYRHVWMEFPLSEREKKKVLFINSAILSMPFLLFIIFVANAVNGELDKQFVESIRPALILHLVNICIVFGHREVKKYLDRADASERAAEKARELKERRRANWDKLSAEFQKRYAEETVKAQDRNQSSADTSKLKDEITDAQQIAQGIRDFFDILRGNKRYAPPPETKKEAPKRSAYVGPIRKNDS